MIDEQMQGHWTYDQLFDECVRLKKDNAKLREIIARCQQIIDEHKARQRG